MSRVRIYWPRLRFRLGPVGVSIGATTASIFALCCGCRLWIIFL